MSNKEKKPIIVSGITPTGHLTIGNYLGAIKNFIKLQNKYQMYIFIADLHALTTNINPSTLNYNIKNIAAFYLAAGLDLKKVVIFKQSDLFSHTSLSWILSSYANMGELLRMTQFKDKSQKLQLEKNKTQVIPVSLFIYPILMAADILLYDADLVPVGKDQKQHLELTKRIAAKFNNKYGKTFQIPDGYISPETGKIMSLQDPTKKMSKSSDDPKSYISLSDSPTVAKNKIKKAVTDSENKIYLSENKPGIKNLLTLYSGLTDCTIQEASEYFKNKNYGELKDETGEVVATFLENLQNNYQLMLKEVDRVLKTGAQKAQIVTNNKLKTIYQKIGLS